MGGIVMVLGILVSNEASLDAGNAQVCASTATTGRLAAVAFGLLVLQGVMVSNIHLSVAAQLNRGQHLQ